MDYCDSISGLKHLRIGGLLNRTTNNIIDVINPLKERINNKKTVLFIMKYHLLKIYSSTTIPENAIIIFALVNSSVVGINNADTVDSFYSCTIPDSNDLKVFQEDQLPGKCLIRVTRDGWHDNYLKFGSLNYFCANHDGGADRRIIDSMESFNLIS